MAEVQVKQEPEPDTEWTNDDDKPIIELARVDVKEEVGYQVEVEFKREPEEVADEDSDWEKMPGTPKVSPKQWAYLLAFLEAHQEMARGMNKNVTPMAKRSTTELWEKLAKGMNNLGSGTRKSANQWREYWRNKRYEVRKKYSCQQKEASEMGREALPVSMYMSAKDERILAILGNEAILGEPNSSQWKDSEDPIAVASYPGRVSPPAPVAPPPAQVARPPAQVARPPAPAPPPPADPAPSAPVVIDASPRSTPSPTPVACDRARSLCLSPTRRIPIKRPQQRAPQPLEWARLMDERRLKMSMRKVRALEHLANSYSAVATAVQTLTQASKATATTMQGVLQEMISIRESIQQESWEGPVCEVEKGEVKVREQEQKEEVNVKKQEQEEEVKVKEQVTRRPTRKCSQKSASSNKKQDSKKNKVTLKKAHTCDICKKTFATSTRLNRHSTVHTKPKKKRVTIRVKKEETYICDVCNKTFDCRTRLTKHRHIHSEERPFSCPDCGKAFKKNTALTKHKRIHAERAYSCGLCGKRFIRKEELLMHIQIHTGDKPFACDECDKTFPVKPYLVRHKLTHKPASYPCDECGKEFTVKKYLVYHKRTHTGEKPHMCDVCNKQFALKVQLNNHKLTHTGEKPYDCDLCDKSFAQLSSLLSHKIRHTGEKAFACDVCDRRFALKWMLNRHKDIHAQETYSCEVCQETFTQRRNLAMHRRIHSDVSEGNEYDVMEKSVYGDGGTN